MRCLRLPAVHASAELSELRGQKQKGFHMTLKKKTYKYETHLHTSETSKCGITPGAEFARHFKSLGYTGIFVTDHFLNGYTTVPQDLPWSERVELFCRGYNQTAQAGAKLGLDVFFGWEYSYGWAHFLTYGLDKAWLLAHPDVLAWDLLHYFDRVHADGGAIVHAHPFREGIDLVPLVPAKTDAIEVINAARPNENNRHALDFAASFGLPRTAGSDIHSAQQKRLCGVTCPRRLTAARDYVAVLKAGETVIFDEIIP
jgi:hypothetical protein